MKPVKKPTKWKYKPERGPASYYGFFKLEFSKHKPKKIEPKMVVNKSSISFLLNSE